MEPEEKRTRRTTSTKGANAAKKEVTSTKATTKKASASKEINTGKKMPAKKVETTPTKAANRKASASKETSVKKTTQGKEASATKKTTTKKVETIEIKANTKKADSAKKVPVKKSNVVKPTNKKKDEEIEQKNTEPETKVENKESELKVKDSKEQENKNQEKKKNKRYVDISVGAILCALIIIALLILNIKLGKHAYGILKNESTNSDVQPENNVSVTQEIGNVLNKTNKLAEEMKEKIIFPSNVVASIYNTQGFNTNTISNELKLILGWASTDDGKKLKSINEKNEEVEALEKQVMSETIKSTLGPNIKYIDEPFNYAKINLFESASRNYGQIIYSDGLYTSILKAEQEEEISPLIYQEIQKVVKYSEKVIVYVKTAFLDTDGNNYQIYKNFKNNNFSDELVQIEHDELFEGVIFDKYTGKGAVTLEENSALNSIRGQLNTYKYTFTFDETLQSYYLSEFAKENA